MTGLLALSVALPAVAATLVVTAFNRDGQDNHGSIRSGRFPSCISCLSLFAFRRERPLALLGLTAALAAGLALGVSSCAWFLWLSLVGAPGAGFIASEIAVCILAVVIAEVGAWLVLRRGVVRAVKSRQTGPLGRSSLGGSEEGARGSAAAVDEPAGMGTEWSRYGPLVVNITKVAFAATLLLAVSGLVIFALKRPHGGNDAWAIWNLRARFLFRGGQHLADAFRLGAARPHTDYPLLVPASVARAWTWSGRETVLAPVLVAAVFTFATYLVLTFAVASIRGAAQGLAAGLVLVATAHFTSAGAMQFSDVPMGFFVLAATVTYVLAGPRRPDNVVDPTGPSSPGRRGRAALALAGAAAGLAAWTKNDGLAFVLAAGVCLGVRACLRGDRKAFAREAGLFALGLAPVLAVVVWFKLRYSPPSEYLSQGLAAALGRLADFGRYLKVGRALLWQVFAFGNGVVLVLAAYVALVGLAPSRKARRALVPAAALGLTLVAYLGVYLISPHELEWHLTHSLDRLLLHLWPAAVFLTFMVTAPLDERGRAENGTPAPQRSQSAQRTARSTGGRSGGPGP